MEYHSTQLQRKLRRAFAQGWLSGAHPTTRDAAVALARKALSQLSPTDQYALVTEAALAEGSDEALIRSCSLLLAVLVFLISKLQSPLRRALVVEQIYAQGRRLCAEVADGVSETRH
jgi:hypothetical protein